MQSRQPGQQLSIEPIGFCVLIVVGPQISGQRDSGIAGGSHHNGDVVLSRRDALPELLEILLAGTKADIAPKQLAGRVSAGGTMQRSAGDVDADPDGHQHLQGVVSRWWMSRQQEPVPVIRYEGSPPHPLGTGMSPGSVTGQGPCRRGPAGDRNQGLRSPQQ